ncbi:uncharacterized protein ACHE_60072A [Aspergillus chevalieri]|uniref:Uncharacterized protein n=1 Tax=Aspergillus chevalieri TaxID=182096 RepID=A0A7R7ZQY5_ASPCH|nr:uncharacterized protein ACHE_60072A [Aspergillus chevalieri]BCR90186.1 hypothetical protein ACHE_60072A [Aspergillus chevalieri]
MNYPFPELPSVVSSLPGQAMKTSPSIMSASGMKTPSWSAPVDVQSLPHHFYYCRKGHKASPQPWGSQQQQQQQQQQ